MDETPIRAGRNRPGRMRRAYFWPVYGEDDEIVFHYAPSRAHTHVPALLGGFQGTLLSDGYEAYAAYARQRAQVTHAACWSHCRRGFEQAMERRLMKAADVIITHSPNDYHPDHCYVSQLVFDSYFQKGLPHIPNQIVCQT